MTPAEHDIVETAPGTVDAVLGGVDLVSTSVGICKCRALLNIRDLSCQGYP